MFPARILFAHSYLFQFIKVETKSRSNTLDMKFVSQVESILKNVFKVSCFLLPFFFEESDFLEKKGGDKSHITSRLTHVFYITTILENAPACMIFFLVFQPQLFQVLILDVMLKLLYFYVYVYIHLMSVPNNHGKVSEVPSVERDRMKREKCRLILWSWPENMM